MGTTLTWTKSGLKLQIETNKRPIPRVTRAYPLPAPGSASASLLTLTLEPHPVNGQEGIRVVSTSAEGLPAWEPNLEWTLHHVSYIGTAPAVLSWESIGLGNIQRLNCYFTPVQLGATHRFFLSARPKQTGTLPAPVTSFPEALIDTPSADLFTGAVASSQELTQAMADDNILSRGEKAQLVREYGAAAADVELLVAKAEATSTPSTAFSAAFAALQAYVLGLQPAWNDTTQDTTISASTWHTLWGDYYRERTSLMLRLAEAPYSQVDLIATTNWSTTTNGTAPTIDGVATTGGELVMLSSQTTKSQNGVWRLVYTPAVGADVWLYPSAATATGENQAMSNAGSAYDGTSSAPNDTSFASVTSCLDGTSLGDAEVVYSGFPSEGLTGTLTVKATPRLELTSEGKSRTVSVFLTTDGGTTWSLVSTWTNAHNGILQTATASISAVQGSQLKVKLVTTSIIPKIPNPTPPPFYTWGEIAVGAVDVHTVALHVPSSAFDNYTFERVQDVLDGSIWSARYGSTHGGKAYTVAVGTDNAFGLTLYDTNALKADKSYVDATFVPGVRTVNGKALSSNVTLAAGDVGAPSGSGTSTGTNTGDQNLSGLVPYTGATSDLDLGSRSLKAKTLDSSSGGAADLHVVTGDEKTQVLDTPVWRDLDFPLIIKTTGSGTPAETTVQGNLQLPNWKVNDALQCGAQELPHTWKEGTTLYFHIHLFTNGTDTTNRYVAFSVEHMYADINGTLSSPATITSSDLLIPANTSAHKHLLLAIGTLALSSEHIGCHIVTRLKRVAASGAAPTNDPWVSMLQAHILNDTQGSRLIGTK